MDSPELHLALQAQDQLLGRLEAKLQQPGMAQDTDIIVASEHGHRPIAGPRNLFPLRQINDGRDAGVDNDWGNSVSGGIRLADQAPCSRPAAMRRATSAASPAHTPRQAIGYPRCCPGPR